jgi:NTP pyrophosphatase (non-canonical NTP hydrolase)
MLMNLVGEVGEFASKIAKDIRKGDIVIGGGIENEIVSKIPVDALLDRFEEYKKEAGDILWQLSGLCFVMGWDLEDVALGNLDKLADR